MRIGELAAQAGVSHRTIHYYERMGLLPAAARGESGHRRYEAEALHQLRRIGALKKIGLSLDEIGEVLDPVPNSHATPRAQERAAGVLKRHILETETHLRELFELRAVLMADLARVEAALRAGKRG